MNDICFSPIELFWIAVIFLVSILILIPIIKLIISIVFERIFAEK